MLTELKNQQVSWVCECGGEFKATGRIKNEHLQQHEHKCDSCGKLEFDFAAFPAFRVRPIRTEIHWQ